MAKAKAKTQDEKKCKLSCICGSNIFKRIATCVVLIPLVLAAFAYGYPFVDIMVFLIGMMFAYEWANMVENKNTSFYAITYATIMAAGVLGFDVLLYSIVFIGALLLMFVKSKAEKNRKLLLLGCVYVGFAMPSILWLYQYSPAALLTYMIIIWATDIGAYIIGSKLRGPRLAPKISPNKTWSGFFGGILVSVLLVGYLAYALFANSSQELSAGGIVWAAVLISIVSVLGQIGDLVESAIKRKLGVKDSSNIIPGHGGIFDRLDSLLFVVPVLFVVNIAVAFFGFSF